RRTANVSSPGRNPDAPANRDVVASQVRTASPRLSFRGTDEQPAASTCEQDSSRPAASRKRQELSGAPQRGPYRGRGVLHRRLDGASHTLPGLPGSLAPLNGGGT